MILNQLSFKQIFESIPGQTLASSWERAVRYFSTLSPLPIETEIASLDLQAIEEGVPASLDAFNITLIPQVILDIVLIQCIRHIEVRKMSQVPYSSVVYLFIKEFSMLKADMT
jgi:hypothetical protein